VRFTYAGKTVDVPMAKAMYSPLETAPNRYRFSCPVYAKQLADTVNVKFMKGDQMIGEELNYSVVTYCKNRINKSNDPAEVALCKALLNYGTASQQLFGYNTENLANESLSAADKVLKDVNASAYKYSVSGSEAGIKAKSATLMLEDVVKVRVYFTLTGDKTIDQYTFTIDGKMVTPSYNDRGYYVETSGIAAKDLEKMFQVKVGGITVTYGALSYVNSKVGGSNVLEASISKALYAYWQAAEALLG
jgi:K+-transporting ATPase c subunit